jgi:hypothetical protein
MKTQFMKDLQLGIVVAVPEGFMALAGVAS